MYSNLNLLLITEPHKNEALKIELDALIALDFGDLDVRTFVPTINDSFKAVKIDGIAEQKI